MTANRMPVVIVVMTVALNTVGIGLIFPVIPDLLLEMGVPTIAQAASIGGLLSLAFALMQFLFGPLLGSLSDRYGRRPVLLVSLITVCIDYAILAVAGTVWLFFLARIVSGIASATFSVANAVLADITPPEKRAAGFGLTGAAFGVGFVLGPAIGGLLGELGPRAPFIAAALLSLVNAVLTFLFLPESLKPENRRSLNWRDANPFAVFGELARRRSLAHLMSVSFLDSLSGFVYPAVWAYYTIAVFGWSTTTIGLSLACYGACVVLMQAGIIRLALRWFGEFGTAVAGLLAGVLGFVILTQLTSGFWALALTPLFAMRAMTATAIAGMLSQSAGSDEQGAIQGIIASITALATLISIPLMSQVFASFMARDEPFPGAPFALAGVFALAALLLLLASRVQRSRTNAHQHP